LPGLVARAALVCTCAFLALPAFEIGYRLHTQRPVLVLDDWRGGRIEDIRFGERGRFDAHLGWAPREEFEGSGYNTLEHGIRRNLYETDLRAGGILAVGDVFTNGGNEVADGETWPAHLERLLRAPVLNGGVVGYATDQIVLRAEQLLPEAQPRVLAIALSEDSIKQAGFSSFGSSKPYYTLERGELVHHAPARGRAQPQAEWRAQARDAMGYSAVLDVVLSSIAPTYWLGDAGEQVFQKADNDPVAVTCGLLQRLKARADADNVRTLLLMQHARNVVAEGGEPGENTRKVVDCAGAMGLEVVDQLGTLRALVAENPAALDALYLQNSGYGQMSPNGNRETAELLARSLGTVSALAK
jgi:hypothetical protein